MPTGLSIVGFVGNTYDRAIYGSSGSSSHRSLRNACMSCLAAAFKSLVFLVRIASTSNARAKLHRGNLEVSGGTFLSMKFIAFVTVSIVRRVFGART